MALSDVFFALVEGGAQLEPTAAAASAFVGSLVQSHINRQLEETQRVFREQLTQFQRRVDEDFVKEHELEISEIAHYCVVTAARTVYEEKKRAAANILWNACFKPSDPDKVALNELDHFGRCLESLSLDAIHVLREAVRIKNPHEVTESRISRSLGIPEDLTVGLLRQLEACDFVLMSFSSATYNGQHSLTIRLRPLAQKFVSYVLDLGNKVME